MRPGLLLFEVSGVAWWDLMKELFDQKLYSIWLFNNNPILVNSRACTQQKKKFQASLHLGPPRPTLSNNYNASRKGELDM